MQIGRPWRELPIGKRLLHDPIQESLLKTDQQHAQAFMDELMKKIQS
jgi:hypothetical protein